MALLAHSVEPFGGEISLGAPVRFAWIDVAPAPTISVSAFVIGESSDEPVVLVDSATLSLMAIAVELSQLTDESSEFADAIAAIAPSFVAEFGPLYDVTDIAGGWSTWSDMRLYSGPYVGSEPGDVGQLVELIRFNDRQS